MTSHKQIADGLSEAQKRLILALDGLEFRDWKALSKNVRTRDKLAVLGLVNFQETGPVRLYFMRRLTPLGMQVRAYLMEQSQ